MDLEKDDIVVNIKNVKARLYDKICEMVADEALEPDDVISTILSYQEIIEILENYKVEQKEKVNGKTANDK